MNDRPALPKEDPWQDTRYTGNAQHFPRHELEGESQATVGEWSDALLAQGRDVLTDGTLDGDGCEIQSIRSMIVCHRNATDLQREINKRMAVLRYGPPRPKPDTFNLTDFERHQVAELEKGQDSTT